MIKKLLCIALLCLSLFLICSCSEFDEDYVYDGASIEGLWQEEDIKHSSYQIYRFYDDGKIELHQYSYGIELLSIYGTYKISGNNDMIIDVVDQYGRNMRYEQKFCLTSKGKFVSLYLDDNLKEQETVLVPFNLNYNEDVKKLEGEWIDKDNPNDVWRFNSDLTGSVGNNEGSYEMYYSTRNGKIYIAYEFIPNLKEAIIESSYELKDNTLTITTTRDKESVVITLEKKN